MSCLVPNCTYTRPGYRGYCNAHYLRFLKHGDPLGFTPRKKKGLCTIEGCGRPHRSKGYCNFHYGEFYTANAKIKRKYCKSTKGRINNAKRSAKIRGISWSLTSEQYEAAIKAGVCYYGCGNKLPEIGCGLDRIDNTIGYEVNNVVPCCTICNRSRMDNFTSAEWKAMIEALIKFRK